MNKKWSWTYRIGFIRNAVSVEIKDDQLEITEGELQRVPLASLRQVELAEHRSVFLMAILALLVIAGFACMAVSVGGGLCILALCALWGYKSSYLLHHFGLNIIAVVDGQEVKFYLSEMGCENLMQIKSALEEYKA